MTTYRGATSCISNYNSSGYQNQERCTFTVLRDIAIFTTRFDTEGYYDQLIVNGQKYVVLTPLHYTVLVSPVYDQPHNSNNTRMYTNTPLYVT